MEAFSDGVIASFSTSVTRRDAQAEPYFAGIRIRKIRYLLTLTSIKPHFAAYFLSSFFVSYFMERETGFEPATSSLRSLQSSATESKLPSQEAVNRNEFNHLWGFRARPLLLVGKPSIKPWTVDTLCLTKGVHWSR